MQTTYIRHLLALFGKKVVLLALLAVMSHSLLGQSVKYKNKRDRPLRYDRKISYGFMLGTHTSAYQVDYSDQFVTQDFDTLHSVTAPFAVGFSLGFLVNLKITSFLDLRLMPKVGFYQRKLEYNYTSSDLSTQLVETAMVEFPLLLKYKSLQRGGIGMYFVGGIMPAIEASGKNDENSTDGIAVRSLDLSLEAGIGFDFQLTFFKFSPEIRFSGGILNLLGPGQSLFNAPLKQLNTNTISLYLIFQ